MYLILHMDNQHGDLGDAVRADIADAEATDAGGLAELRQGMLRLERDFTRSSSVVSLISSNGHLCSGSVSLRPSPCLPESCAKGTAARTSDQHMALILADELKSLRETAYLLRSPRNARRLLESLARAMRGEGEPSTIADLREQLGLSEQERKDR